jgi:acyl-CoA hydrolase
MIFSEPVNIGDILTLKARLVYVGTSSMEILVDILTEKLKEGKTLKVGKAWLTMVALGDDCRPVDVPALRLSGPKEKALSRQALLRRKRRLQQL